MTPKKRGTRKQQGFLERLEKGANRALDIADTLAGSSQDISDKTLGLAGVVTALGLLYRNDRATYDAAADFCRMIYVGHEYAEKAASAAQRKTIAQNYLPSWAKAQYKSIDKAVEAASRIYSAKSSNSFSHTYEGIEARGGKSNASVKDPRYHLEFGRTTLDISYKTAEYIAMKGVDIVSRAENGIDGISKVVDRASQIYKKLRGGDGE